MGTTPTTRMVIQSDPAKVPVVQETILREVEAAGYDKNARFAIRLSLEEAVSNAICHGNASDPSKKVTINYVVDADQVRITVCDEGPGFCPDDLPDPTTSENLCQPHGRGVMLIQAYMTEVKFADCGRCLEMVKARDCCKPHSELADEAS